MMSGSRCALSAEQLVAPRVAVADVAHWESLSHVATVKDMSQHALAALANSQADIIYLHMPVPHPPAFWDRRSHNYGVGGSYLDSLDYSDRFLGQILDVLEARAALAADDLDPPGRSLLAHQNMAHNSRMERRGRARF